MEQYRDFWISGTAVPGPPFTDYWHARGSVNLLRPDASLVEIVRFTLESMEWEDQGVATLFGVELVRLVWIPPTMNSLTRVQGSTNPELSPCEDGKAKLPITL